jgi:hypothetical protein
MGSSASLTRSPRQCDPKSSDLSEPDRDTVWRRRDRSCRLLRLYRLDNLTSGGLASVVPQAPLASEIHGSLQVPTPELRDGILGLDHRRRCGIQLGSGILPVLQAEINPQNLLKRLDAAGKAQPCAEARKMICPLRPGEWPLRSSSVRSESQAGITACCGSGSDVQLASSLRSDLR